LDFSVLDDQALILQIAAAQSAALSELYDRYGRLVFSLALRIVGETGLAEEITQDVFVQLWNKANSYHSEQGKVVTWLTSFARYRAIDALRRQNVRPEGHRVEWAEGISPDLVDPVILELTVDLEQQKLHLRAALARLPEEQRRVLALAYFSGMSHQEIATTLHEPLGTVKTRVRLAMQKLRQILADQRVVETQEDPDA
jgi:RNA polymerase sigma-70 factor, ECF subfamily